jgi:hypothetical protein
MGSLPYLNPDVNDELNVGLLLLLVHELGRTDRGRLLLNNERLLIFLYLVKNPVMLERVLLELGRQGVVLDDVEAYSVNSISVNVDPLFDNAWIKRILRYAASRKFISAVLRKSDGFMYLLSEEGERVVKDLNGDYFNRVREYAIKLKQLNTTSNSNLNKLLNSIFRG